MIPNLLDHLTSKVLFALTFFLFAGGFIASTNADDKVAQSSGDWDSITWVTSGTPTVGDDVYITDDFSVDYTSGATTVNLIYVATATSSPVSENGSLTVSSGTLTATGNSTSALRIGESTSGTGTLTVTGGLLQTPNGYLNIATVTGGAGDVTISGGKVEAGLGVLIGSADGAQGSLLIDGGELESGDILYVGRRSTGSITGSFEQTSGTTSFTNASANRQVMRVGYAGAANQVMNVTAEITGGSFSGAILVGRQASVITGGGSSTMIIGSAADISGNTEAWEVSATGELIFELGTDDSFNAVDLSLSTDAEAISFTQSGAKVTIDGSALAFGSYGPITLIEYASGKGPNGTSLGNVTYDFIGFDGGFGSPSLNWTDTALVLTVPEPSVLGLIGLASLLGLARRRRS